MKSSSSSVLSVVMRTILPVHRYLAVALGLLMTLWCLSGFVMMYQGYPSLTDAERLQGLAPLDLSGCCDFPALGLDRAAPVRGFSVEMLLGDPVLRLSSGRRSGAAGPLDLRTGRRVGPLSAGQAEEVAREYGEGHGFGAAPELLGTVEIDQWTIQNARRNQPVYHFAFHDSAATEIYVSGVSGEVFQDTNRRERILAWLGAIPHWLYPVQLRQNAALWTQIVIWTSVLGSFLALTGLCVGIWRFRLRAAAGRRSPFRGWWYWHHISGLVFGVLALTWVFSGLMTMNPWGALTGGGGGRYSAELRGGAAWGDVERFLSAASRAAPRAGLVQLRSATFGGRLYALAVDSGGGRTRLDAGARPAPLERAEVEAALVRLKLPVERFELMTHADSYYSGAAGSPPVYRALLDDPGATRLYINGLSGSVRAVAGPQRAYRWVVSGLHDFDFALLRARPLWDLVVLPLLAGVTLLCATGTWLALKRVRLDLRRLRRACRRSSARLRRASGRAASREPAS